ncbi:hypothetical protein O0Q62_003657 [Proteus mirabilis]|nr:hypothetical protein [Proteus mirabilis]ELB1172029.1 hypothetical protein [Proteus mirabilis]MBI6506078.1 hypothetical protein [Proteus mirabilis]
MKLFHILLNVTNADWTKKGEIKSFFEVANSKTEIKEKFTIFSNAVLSSIDEYDLFLTPVVVKFHMSAYNINKEIIYCESQPTIVNNTFDLIEKIKSFKDKDYITVNWEII